MTKGLIMDKARWKKILSSEASIILVLLLLCVVVAISAPAFLSGRNILNVLARTASTGVVAIGMTFVIATAGIDLSVGGQVTLMGILLATFLRQGMPLPLVLLLVLFIGIGFGAFNGLVISKLKFPPFMVTLSLQLITFGFSLFITGGRSIPIDAPGFYFFGLGNILGLPVPVWIFLLVAAGGFLLSRNFSIGRKILAVGSNAKGAWYAGINVSGVITIAYIITGITAFISAVILSSRLVNASAVLGRGLELNAIAAVVIGGTSLAGGNSFIIGTVAGALIIEVIANWLTLNNVNPFLRDVVKGGIILLALFIDVIRRGKLTKNEFAG